MTWETTLKVSKFPPFYFHPPLISAMGSYELLELLNRCPWVYQWCSLNWIAVCWRFRSLLLCIKVDNAPIGNFYIQNSWSCIWLMNIWFSREMDTNLLLIASHFLLVRPAIYLTRCIFCLCMIISWRACLGISLH